MAKLIRPTVKSNLEIADKIYEMVLEGDFEGFEPGCFVHIKCPSQLLRRPISICDIRGREMILLYRAEGAGTKALTAYEVGVEVDMLAPLGQGFSVEASGDVALLIGGGIGVPPLYYLGRLLKQRGVTVKSILGFNAEKDIFYADKFAELGETYVTTVIASETNSVILSAAKDPHATTKGSFALRAQDDSSFARNDINYQQGFVTGVINKVGAWDTLYSCGPTAMLRALQGCVDPEKTAFISLEERMGCGVGACLACVCDLAERREKSYVRVCTEGPVFKMHDVVLL